MMTNQQFSRRQFCQLSAGLALAAGMDCDFSKKSIPIGLQLYSVRSECKKDFFKTIESVAKLGYQGVEFAGYYEKSAKDIKTVLNDNGLKCCGTHTQYPDMQPEFINKTIEFNLELGNKYIIIPWIGEEMRNSKEAWLETAEIFNQFAEDLKPHNLRIGYHNHHFEFHAIDDQMPWDIFAQNTSDDVILQLDTGNAAHGGVDPLQFLEKYANRTTTIHLKEFSETNKNALIGEGDIPWNNVFDICEKSGETQWYIIEEEKDVLPPIKSADVSLKNLKKLQETRG